MEKERDAKTATTDHGSGHKATTPIPAQPCQQPPARRRQLRQTCVHTLIKPRVDFRQKGVNYGIAVLRTEFPMSLGCRAKVLARHRGRTHRIRVTAISYRTLEAHRAEPSFNAWTSGRPAG
jgi:hypothetical protein